MKIAILGGAGQIGFHLARHFNAQSAGSAVALCRSALVSAALDYAQIPFRVYDTTSRASVHSALIGCDVVIDSSFAPLPNLRNAGSVRAFYDSVVTAPDLKQLIHFSSVAVYGEISARAPTFDNPLPDTIYGQQKLATERIVQRAAELHSLPSLILRLGHVYGVEMPWSRQWINRLRENQLPLDNWNKPSNAVHVMQVCAAIQRAVDRKLAGCSNLLGAPNLSWGQIFAWHRAALDTLSLPPMPSLYQPHRTSPALYSTGPARLVRDTMHKMKSTVRMRLTKSVRLTQFIRTMFAKLPFAPIVADLKVNAGARARETFFSQSAAAEADYIFDSLPLTGPLLDARYTPVAGDLEALRKWLRGVALPDAATSYVSETLLADPAVAEAC